MSSVNESALRRKTASFRLATKRWRLARLVLVLAGIWLAARLALALLPWPALDDFLGRPYSTRLYDRRGQLLQVLPLEDGLRREWYDLKALPPRLVEVFLAAEDQRFYRHHGVDFVAVLRAAAQNLRAGRRVSGASTITMQLVRLVRPRLFGKEVGLWTKAMEALAAVRLELRLSKEEILELYLNNLPFGSQTEGVGSAARTYFGCIPAELSEAQIHSIAILPRRPAAYHPSNPDASLEAALQLGSLTGFSTTSQHWREALSQPEPYQYPQRLSHFCRYAQNLYSDGSKIPSELHLSVDADLTEAAERLVQMQLAKHRAARLGHGAVFAMDNETGEIICWSGGDFWSQDAGQVDGVLVRNQSGSTMKPFIYAMALEAGFSPTTVLADVPMDFGGGEAYVPLNFNNRFNGPVLFRTALASSLNIPAVYLMYWLGVERYLSVMGRLGARSLEGLEDYGLSLALGSGELSLLELVRAFSVFPRGGRSAHLTHLREGMVGEAARLEGEQVFQQDTAAIICDMLSDQRARALGFGFSGVFSTPYPAIFKTGTSNQFQNIVALAATPRYTVGVWMGNHSGETVVSQTGSSLPAAIARFLLDELVERGLESENARYSNTSNKTGFPQDFPKPRSYRKTRVCALSGMSPMEFCPATTEEFVLSVLSDSAMAGKGLEPCSWHFSAEDLFSAGISSSIKAVSVRYPQEYHRWLQGKTSSSDFFHQAPLQILYPQPGAVFVYDESIPSSAQRIRVDATGTGSQAELFVNGKSVGPSAAPFSWLVPLEPGTMRLEVVLEDGQRVGREIFVR